MTNNRKIVRQMGALADPCPDCGESAVAIIKTSEVVGLKIVTSLDARLANAEPEAKLHAIEAFNRCLACGFGQKFGFNDAGFWGLLKTVKDWGQLNETPAQP